MATHKRITALPALFALTLALAATGCATVTHQRYALTPAPNECQATEARPTWQSNIVGVVCWDAQGKPIGMGAAAGTSTAAVTTSLIGSTSTLVQSAATLGAGALIADGLRGAAKTIDGATIKAVTSGSVTTTGTVGGTVNVGSIPNVSVNPVTGAFQLLAP